MAWSDMEFNRTNLFLLRSLIEACDKGEVKGDGNWVSEKEARYWNCVALLAYEDGERGGDIVHRVLEYWLDCGTRTGGWEIHPAGPSREDWERFKWESDFYKAWGASPGSNRKKPDASRYVPPPFGAVGYYHSITRGEN